MTSSLFPQLEPGTRLVGIAKLAAQGEAVDEGHNVEYVTIENRSLLTRCTSRRVPFAWAINPYRGCEFACKYCYARYTHEFMELREGLDFERRIFVKQHTGWLLRQELKKVRPDQSIAIGSATDPYQPAERRFEVTRSILEELARHQGLKIGLITKSNLIVRDLPALQAVAAGNQLSVYLTITTLRADLARLIEPRAPRPDLRLLAVRKLVEAGIHTGVSLAPVLPGITDSPCDLEDVVRASAEASAFHIMSGALFLKPCSEKVFMPFLEEKFPHLTPVYKDRYSNGAFLSPEYARRISQLVSKYSEKHHVGGGKRPPARALAAHLAGRLPQQTTLF
ncbi:MAG TPA: radical SAM protein [Candidatus Saccharimonadales bacterium]|jgi:DNA repair photolyase|nr:radical SAM protein [Candidatus Saccharimonadales bacterium]